VSLSAVGVINDHNLSGLAHTIHISSVVVLDPQLQSQSH
jgi:hypothetical protein